MKTRTLMISAAIAAVLNCAPVNAQLLGGGVAGGLGGTLSGGMRDVDVMTRGGMNGSLGTELDTGSVRDRATGVGSRIGNRTRDTVGAVRERSESKIGDVRGAASSTARAGVGTAAEAASTANHIDSSVDAAGSLVSSSNVDGSEIAGAADMAASKQLVAQPEIGGIAGNGALDSTAEAAGEAAGDIKHQDHKTTSSLTGAAEGMTQSDLNNAKEGDGANRQVIADGALSGEAAGNAAATKSPLASNVDGGAQGAASGNASASKKGVSARSSASAEAQGSASVAHR